MNQDDKNFEAWLIQELAKAVEMSKVVDFQQRKAATNRVDLLDAGMKVWLEFKSRVTV